MRDFANKMELLDELDEIIYVCDPATFELLFLNKQAKKVFQVGLQKENCCYRILRDRDLPCEQCPIRYLKEGEQRVREVYNRRLGLHLMQKEKLIRWNGRIASLTVAEDISKEENVSRDIRDRLEMGQTLVRAIHLLTEAESTEESVGAVLRLVGEFLEADRVYILELVDRAYLSSTYEWCGKRVESGKKQLERIPVWAMRRWADALTGQNKIMTHSVEEIRYEHIYEYEIWKSRQVQSLYAVPLVPEVHAMAAGYLTVENPKELKQLFDLLDSAAYFLTGEIYRHRMQGRLDYSNCHDALTGVYNRQKYLEFIRDYSGEDVPVGVVFANINGLKKLNERFGYYYGNSVIFDTAALLKKYFPEASIFRLGGDEFVVVAENCAKNIFQEMVRRLLQECAQKEYYSVAVGYLWQNLEVDLLAMIQKAEEYMVLNKKDYYRIGDVDGKKYNKSTLDGLLEALENGMFEMYLQPKISLATDRIAGAEALVRLNHPDLGVISPGKFIPLLEEEKIIKYVDFFVFEEVCKALERWKKQNRTLITLSLNFSRLTILEPDLARKIEEIRKRYDVEKKWIEIEITETAGEVEREKIVEISDELKQLGYQISLDDFGARYSNMSLLTMMDFDMLKLDKSLIDRLVDNKKSQIVVQRVIDTCKDMGIESIAEGVETLEQAELLRQQSCDYAQGYYYGKPMRLYEFETKYQ